MMNRRAFLAAATAFPILGADIGRAAAITPVDPLTVCLAQIPGTPADSGDSQLVLFQYADFTDSSLADLANPRAATPDSDTTLRADMLPVDPTFLAHFAFDWEAEIGFDPNAVAQTAVAFQPPSTVRSFLGEFDVDRIVAAQKARGYTEDAADDWILLTSPSGESISLKDPVDAMVLANLHYLAVRTGQIVAAPKASGLSHVVGGGARSEKSLADVWNETDLAPVTAGWPGISALSGAYVSAGSLGLSVDADTGEIPGSAGFAAGVTGSNSEYSVVMALAFGSGEEAEQSVPIIEDRLAKGTSLVTNAPYRDVFGEASVRVDDDRPVAIVEFTDPRMLQRWQQALNSRDLAFLATR
jgi:hypothetical protein